MDDSKKNVLFDFDGVIADSFGAAILANKMINPGITDNEFRDLFNGNINDIKINLPEDKAKKADKQFFDTYIPLVMKLARVFPGMTDAIVKLSKNYNLVIISSTITSPIKEFMKKNKLDLYFDEIMGNDIHNSKSEKIRMIFSKYSVEPKDCIFITDTLGDIREACNAGIKSIGVSWGFHKKENLLTGNPYQIAEKPEDLCNIVSNYFNEF
jgi:phosphoglycolate phosphatase